ncbi:hypothetical protein ICN84_05340 [Akkermansia glycaniphila]|uniref:hypothetical protein n=1 Tax=Akkermansia glycaniphila TaxID=1679444 RepID=UPI001C01F673|nr:hypothetical protein [Akkermansia glycaniphila]MBT9449498.1 hypothetical protein [Akkermansia glycaniphila]
MMKFFFFMTMAYQAYASPEPPYVTETDEPTQEGTLAFSYSELYADIVCIKESACTATKYYELYYYINQGRCVYMICKVRQQVWDPQTDDWKYDGTQIVYSETVLGADFSNDSEKSKIMKAISSEEPMDARFAEAWRHVTQYMANKKASGTTSSNRTDTARKQKRSCTKTHSVEPGSAGLFRFVLA